MKNRRSNITDQFVWNNNTIFMTVGFDDDLRVCEVFLSSKAMNNMGRLLVDVGLLISRCLRAETIEKLVTHFPFETPTGADGKRDMDQETITTIVIRKLSDIAKEIKELKL